jgi:hypothetical protein
MDRPRRHPSPFIQGPVWRPPSPEPSFSPVSRYDVLWCFFLVVAFLLLGCCLGVPCGVLGLLGSPPELGLGQRTAQPVRLNLMN